MDARVLTEVLIGNKIVNLDSRVTALTTSAKVQLFPDPNTGIRITDGTNDVFKCITGGADVGDVILGDPNGQNVKWDNSAGTVVVTGSVTIAAGTLDGTEFKATANITCGTGNNVIRLSGDDSTYRLWLGHATAASAPFRVTKAGVLTAVGATIETASSGARVRIFPDPNTGIQVIDDGGADVLKALVGGDNVGDVIIGSMSGQYVKWDKSASALIINAVLDASNGGLKTGSGSERLEIGGFGVAGDAHTMRIKYGSSDKVTLHANSGKGTVVLEGDGIVYIKIDASNWASLEGDRFYMVDGSANYISINLTTGIDSHIGNINTTGVYKVSGAQVVGAQGAAVADASETVASVKTQLNALLSRLRNHGLIAT